MGYELAIRPRNQESPLQAAVLAARLERAARDGLDAEPPREAAAPAETAPTPPAEAAPASPGPWSLPNGKARLAARIYRTETGAVGGVDFEIPLGGSEAELRDAVQFVLRCADDWSGLVFDPQLGRELTRATADDAVAKWRESQSYAAEISGLYDDPRGVVEFQAPPPVVSARAQGVLLLAAGFLVLYWLVGVLIESVAR